MIDAGQYLSFECPTVRAGASGLNFLPRTLTRIPIRVDTFGPAPSPETKNID